jgi:hypothetical protein
MTYVRNKMNETREELENCFQAASELQGAINDLESKMANARPLSQTSSLLDIAMELIDDAMESL